MKVFITGASGFLGKAIVGKLLVTSIIIALIIFTGLGGYLYISSPSQAQEEKTKRPVIKDIKVSSPIIPFESHGDLWFSTWADDNTLFVSWGDGFGPDYNKTAGFSHHGLARLRGTFPNIKSEVVNRFMLLSDDVNNSNLTRMPNDSVLDYSAWTYFTSLDEKDNPKWSKNYLDAVPSPGISTKLLLSPSMLFSSIYHPEISCKEVSADESICFIFNIILCNCFSGNSFSDRGNFFKKHLFL